VKGIVFVVFPLHTQKEPGTERAEHLANVQLQMLILQGTRDALAELDLITKTVASLGARATLHVVQGGDHSFEVLVSSGRKAEEVRAELVLTMAAWMSREGA